MRKAKEGFESLKKEVKAGTADAALLDTAAARLKTTLAQNSQESAVLTRAVLAQQAANKAAAGSTDELAAKQKLLTLQVNALGAAQKKTGEGKELVNQLRAVNDELIKQGLDLNDGRRNVGRYAESIKAAGVGVKDFKGGLNAAVSQGLSPFRGELERGSGILGKFKAGSDLVKTGLASLKGAGETGAQGFKAVGAGIALSGLGLLLIILSSVYTYFTQSAEGGKILKQALAGVGAVVNLLLGTVTSFGKAVVEAFSKPGETIEKLGRLILDNLINRFTAFAVIFEGLKTGNLAKIADGAVQATTGIANASEKAQQLGQSLKKVAEEAANAARQAGQIEKEGQRLVKVRREVELQEKKEQGQLEVLLRLSRDQNLTHEERKQKLREAGEIERRASERIIDLNQRELVQLERKLALANGSKAAGEIKADIAAKELELQDKANERESTYAKIRVRESGQDAALRAEASAAAKAAAAARQQAILDEIKTRIAATERELLTVRQGSQQELELHEKLVGQKAELEKAGEKKTAADRKLIVAQSVAEILKLEDEFLAKRQERAIKFLADGDAQRVTALNAEKKREADAAKEREDAYKEQEGILERTLNRRRAEVEKDYAEGLTDKKEYERSLAILEQMSFGGRIVLAKQFNKDTTKLQAEQAARERALLVGQREQQQAELKSKIADAEAFGAEVGQLLAQTITDTGASTEQFFTKLVVLVLDAVEKIVLAQQAAATAQALAQPDSVATFGATGVARAGVINALIIAAFETAKGAIEASSNAQKFATGGIVGGASYAGDTVPVLANSGEFILRREVGQLAPEIPGILGWLNAQAGGVNFAPGYSPTVPAQPQMFDGGLMARQVGNNQPIQIDYQQLADAFRVNPLKVGFASWVEAGTEYYKPSRFSSLGNKGAGSDFARQFRR